MSGASEVQEFTFWRYTNLHGIFCQAEDSGTVLAGILRDSEWSFRRCVEMKGLLVCGPIWHWYDPTLLELSGYSTPVGRHYMQADVIEADIIDLSAAVGELR